MTAPGSFYSTAAWQAARLEACQRARWKCRFCGESVAGKRRSRVDHIKTLKEAPELALVQGNLRVLCVRCDAARHSEKGHRIVERAPIGLDGFPE